MTKPGDFACVASKQAKFVIAKAAKKKLVIIIEIMFKSPKQQLFFETRKPKISTIKENLFCLKVFLNHYKFFILKFTNADNCSSYGKSQEISSKWVVVTSMAFMEKL